MERGRGARGGGGGELHRACVRAAGKNTPHPCTRPRLHGRIPRHEPDAALIERRRLGALLSRQIDLAEQVGPALVVIWGGGGGCDGPWGEWKSGLQ